MAVKKNRKYRKSTDKRMCKGHTFIFKKIKRLFDMGADPECSERNRRMCARNSFRGVLQSLRCKSAFRLFVPMLVEIFTENGF